MEVTVKMYPEEYDLFREYQREKASLERGNERRLRPLMRKAWEFVQKNPRRDHRFGGNDLRRR